MEGLVSAYDSGTGVLTFDVDHSDSSGGVGPFASWNINLAGDVGASGTIAPVQGVASGIVTTNSDVYVALGDFPDDGPSATATVPASGDLVVILTGELSTNNKTGTAYMSVSLNNSIALDANSLRVTGDNPVRASITVLITNLTPGNVINFSAVYRAANNTGASDTTGTFNARQIIVIPA
jgi:hypothetical protein